MTAVLTSHQLVAEHDVNTVDLFRWRKRGWLHPEVIHRGGSALNPYTSSLWPDWTGRMVRLLQLDRVGPGAPGGRSDTGTTARSRLYAGVASVLAEHPDVGWVVILDGLEPVPCWTPLAVVTACASVDVIATIVAVPA